MDGIFKVEKNHKKNSKFIHTHTHTHIYRGQRSRLRSRDFSVDPRGVGSLGRRVSGGELGPSEFDLRGPGGEPA